MYIKMAGVLPTHPILLNKVPIGSLWGGASGLQDAAMPAPGAGAVWPDTIHHQTNAITAGDAFAKVWTSCSFWIDEVNVSNDLMISGFVDNNNLNRMVTYFGRDNVVIRDVQYPYNNITHPQFFNLMNPIVRDLLFISMHAVADFYINHQDWIATILASMGDIIQNPQAFLERYDDRRGGWTNTQAVNRETAFRNIKLFDLQPKRRPWQNLDGPVGWHQDFIAPYAIDNTLQYLGGTCNIPARIRTLAPSQPEFRYEYSAYVIPPIGPPVNNWDDINLRQYIFYWADYLIQHSGPVKPSMCPAMFRDFIYIGWTDLYTMCSLRRQNTPHLGQMGQLYNYFFPLEQRLAGATLSGNVAPPANQTAEYYLTQYIRENYASLLVGDGFWRVICNLP